MADKLNYKVGMIGALDMLRFKNMPKVREKAIQAASSAPLPQTLTTNEKAKQRHPEKQEVIVAEIRRNGADAKTIVLKTEDGSALAPFRAGQYISVCVPIKQLAKQNAGLSNIEITEGNIKAFEQTAKKYGIDFALKKDSTETPPRYLVFFKGRDADALTAAFKEFSAKKLNKEQKPSIRKALATFREAAKQLNANRQKTKHKDREVSL